MKPTLRSSMYAVLVLCMCFTMPLANAANYVINFSATGVSSTLDSVVVKNLSKGTSITVPAGMSLNLTDITALPLLSDESAYIALYPNPMPGKATFNFYAKQSGTAQISILSLDGRKMAEITQYLQVGNHSFKLSVPAGVYLLQTKGMEYNYSAKIISHFESKKQPEITYTGTLSLKNLHQQIKSATVTMPYTAGDMLLYKGYSGKNSSLLSDIPTNSSTSNFELVECKDAGGKYYTTTRIGTQIWMAENLAFLPTVNLKAEGSNISGRSGESFYYVYDYDGTDITAAKSSVNYSTYGVLYNWNASQTSAPAGWHVPTDGEWTYMVNYLGGESGVGSKLKSTTGWNSPNNGAINSSCFSALPAGIHLETNFLNLTSSGNWWSASESTNGNVWQRNLNYSTQDITRDNTIKHAGMSIRCVKDNTLKGSFLPAEGTLTSYQIGTIKCRNISLSDSVYKAKIDGKDVDLIVLNDSTISFFTPSINATSCNLNVTIDRIPYEIQYTVAVNNSITNPADFVNEFVTKSNLAIDTMSTQIALIASDGVVNGSTEQGIISSLRDSINYYYQQFQFLSNEDKMIAAQILATNMPELNPASGKMSLRPVYKVITADDLPTRSEMMKIEMTKYNSSSFKYKLIEKTKSLLPLLSLFPPLSPVSKITLKLISFYWGTEINDYMLKGMELAALPYHPTEIILNDPPAIFKYDEPIKIGMNVKFRNVRINLGAEDLAWEQDFSKTFLHFIVEYNTSLINLYFSNKRHFPAPLTPTLLPEKISVLTVKLNDATINSSVSGGNSNVLAELTSTQSTTKNIKYNVIYQDNNFNLKSEIIDAVVKGEPYSVQIVSGNNQPGELGKNLPLPLKVLVKDKSGIPFANAKVNFTAANGGSVSVAQVTTLTDGMASVIWTLGSTASTQTVSVTVFKSDNTTAVVGSPLTFTAVVNEPYSIEKVSGDKQNGEVGKTLPKTIKVLVKNALGNPFVGEKVKFLDGFSNTETTVTTGTDGTASFSWTLGFTPDTQTLTVSAFKKDNVTAIIGSPLSFTATTLDKNAPYSIEKLSGDNQNGEPGKKLPLPLKVLVKTIEGLACNGASVAFSSGSFAFPDTEVLTGADGIASYDWTLGNTLSVQTISVSGGYVNPLPLQGAPLTFSANSGIEAYSIEKVSGDNQTAHVGTKLTIPLKVLLKDKTGIPCAGAKVIFSTTSNPVMPITVSSGTDGIASFEWTLGSTDGIQKMNVNSYKLDESTNILGSPIVFTATANGPYSIQKVSGDNQGGELGKKLPLPLKVLVKDKSGAAYPGTTVYFNVNNGGSVSASSAITGADGTASVNWTLGTTVTSQTVTAKAYKYDGTTSLTGSPSTFNATMSPDTISAIRRLLENKIWNSAYGAWSVLYQSIYTVSFGECCYGASGTTYTWYFHYDPVTKIVYVDGIHGYNGYTRYFKLVSISASGFSLVCIPGSNCEVGSISSFPL